MRLVIMPAIAGMIFASTALAQERSASATQGGPLGDPQRHGSADHQRLRQRGSGLSIQ